MTNFWVIWHIFLQYLIPTLERTNHQNELAALEVSLELSCVWRDVPEWEKKKWEKNRGMGWFFFLKFLREIFFFWLLRIKCCLFSFRFFFFWKIQTGKPTSTSSQFGKNHKRNRVGWEKGQIGRRHQTSTRNRQGSRSRCSSNAWYGNAPQFWEKKWSIFVSYCELFCSQKKNRRRNLFFQVHWQVRWGSIVSDLWRPFGRATHV